MLMHLLRLVFAPARFIEIVASRIVAEDRIKNPSVVGPDGQYPEDRRADIHGSVSKQTHSIRRAFAFGTLITLLTIAVGAAIGYCLGQTYGVPPKFIVYFLQASGAAAVLGATLAEVGSEIMTWDRESIPERMNQLIFRGLYVFGTFLFVMSLSWDAA
jgi:hypothetical protein